MICHCLESLPQMHDGEILDGNFALMHIGQDQRAWFAGQHGDAVVVKLCGNAGGAGDDEECGGGGGQGEGGAVDMSGDGRVSEAAFLGLGEEMSRVAGDGSP